MSTMDVSFTADELEALALEAGQRNTTTAELIRQRAAMTAPDDAVDAAIALTVERSAELNRRLA